MKDRIKDLRIIKEDYLTKKLEFFKTIKKDYSNCFVDISKLKADIVSELYILLSSIPIHKTLRYKVYKGNQDTWYDRDLFWRPPYDDFYPEHQSYGVGFITVGNSKELEIKKNKLIFCNGTYQGKKSITTIDFSKIKSLHKDKVIEFLECTQEFLTLDKELSIEKNDVTFSIDDGGTTEFKCNNDNEMFCLENCIHLEDTGSTQDYSRDRIDNIIKELSNELKGSKPLANEINMKTILEILKDLNIERKIYIDQLKLLLTKVQTKNYAFKLIKQI